MHQVVLITGASSGIGLALAAYLAEQGCRVFGTSRRPGADRLHSFELLPLDVASDESVAHCVQSVLQRAGHIDVLINNVGADLFGALEEVTVDELKALFETNYFGAVRVTQAVLPQMRARRTGQIINVSSAMGLAALPFEGSYAATKHALEAFSESLYYEVQPFGIHVAILEPGFYRSNIRVRGTEAAAQLPDYAAARAQMRAYMDQAVDHGDDPRRLGPYVAWIIAQRPPLFRYPATPETFAVSLGKRWSFFLIFAYFYQRFTGQKPWRGELTVLSAAGAALIFYLLSRGFTRKRG